jgi:hypothetical protein
MGASARAVRIAITIEVEARGSRLGDRGSGSRLGIEVHGSRLGAHEPWLDDDLDLGLLLGPSSRQQVRRQPAAGIGPAR